MSEEPISLVLEMLPRIDRRLDAIEAVVLNTRASLHSLEDQMATVRQDIVRMCYRLALSDGRLARVERRLDLIEA